MAKKFLIGIDLGGTNLKVGLLNDRLYLKRKEILNTKQYRKKEDLISAIFCCVNMIIERSLLGKNDVLSVGVGLPGPVDAHGGIVHFLPNIPGWKEVNLKNILQKKIKIPVFIDNDAKVMALAEYAKGAAKGFKNSMCLTLGTGIGSGIILNGQIYRGSDNAAGEIGHLPINEDGPYCNCGGIACLESYVGNSRIILEAMKVFKKRISLEDLSDLAYRKNAKAIIIWQKVGERIGVALTSAINLLNLDAVVIGGGVANVGSILFDQIKQTIKKRAMSVQSRRVKIFKAKLGDNAGIIGAAILAKEMSRK